MVNNQKNYEYVLPVGTVLISKNSPDGKERRRYTIEQVVNGRALPKGQKVKDGDEVKPVLGQGGFGITYLASRQVKDENINLGTHYYAIKEFFMKGSCYRDEGSTQMLYSPAAASDVKESLKDFKEEAKRLKEICNGNPNIVNVNEVFEANGTAYYVMEFLEGESLRSLVKRTGPLSEVVALSYIRPIAEAVSYIHTHHRLLHLDIKPDNIILRKDDDRQTAEPVLIDFGVSVHFNKKGDVTTTHSSTGQSEGYSPMEQYGGIAKIIENRRQAQRDGFATFSLIPCEVDVYALGATLYYMLVGANPYNAFSMSPHIVGEKLPQNLSEKTRRVVTEAMQPLAANRTQTVADFLKGFSDRYTLPKGYVLKSPNVQYLITEIQEESDNYIRYGATLFMGSQSDESGNVTTKRRYLVYERFNTRMYKREKDESVSLQERTEAIQTQIRKEFQVVIKKYVGMTADGEADFENNIIVREVFDTNGTTYAAVKWGWKPPLPFGEIFDYLWRKFKSVAVFALGAFLVAYGVNYVINRCSQPQGETSEPRKETAIRVENFKYTVPDIGTGLYTGLLDADSLPHDTKAKIFFAEDNVYEGAFVHGKLEGTDIVYTIAGQTFEGSFKNNQFDEGKLTTRDGQYFKGTFRDKQPYNGAWYDTNGNVISRLEDGQYK